MCAYQLQFKLTKQSDLCVFVTLNEKNEPILNAELITQIFVFIINYSCNIF